VNQDLDKKLCEKYPKIFKDRHGDPKQTLMCFGFECGDGWYSILDALCSNIQHHIDWNNQNHAKGFKQYKEVPQVVAVQIKEKFGGLRFYYDGGDDHISGMVRMAESWADRTCEECGGPGYARRGGWIKTLCDHHEEIRQEHYRQREMKLSGLEE